VPRVRNGGVYVEMLVYVRNVDVFAAVWPGALDELIVRHLLFRVGLVSGKVGTAMSDNEW